MESDGNAGEADGQQTLRLSDPPQRGWKRAIVALALPYAPFSTSRRQIQLQTLPRFEIVEQPDDPVDVRVLVVEAADRELAVEPGQAPRREKGQFAGADGIGVKVPDVVET